MARFRKAMATALALVMLSGSVLGADANRSLAQAGGEAAVENGAANDAEPEKTEAGSAELSDGTEKSETEETPQEISEIEETSGAEEAEEAEEVPGTDETDEDSEEEEAEQTAESQEELIPVEDVFSVAYSTLPEDGGVFDYILDPQRLITATDNAAYGGIDFEEGATFFFRNHMDGDVVRYSSQSDAISIVNRSTVPVNVKLEVKVTGEEGIVMTSGPSFEGDGSASLYLAVTDGEEVKTILQGETAVLTMEIPAAASDAYQIVYDEDSEAFVYELTGEAKTDGYDGFAEKSFYLIGNCNPDGAWENFDGKLPTLSVTWSVNPSVT